MNYAQKHNFFRDFWLYRTFLIMIAPAVLYFFIFAYLPMGGIVIAFKQFNYEGGIFGSPWSGLENFRFLFISGDAWRVTRNTVLYNIAFMAVNTVLQISMAIIISEIPGKIYKKVMQSSMFLPYFISWVVVGAFIYNIFNYEFGSLNVMLKSVGMMPTDVYSNIGAWKYIIIFFRAWKDIGYGTILYLAAIMSIEQEMYEAADIDGAGIIKKIVHITIPCLIPTIIILLLLSVSSIFRGDFGMFYNIVGNNGSLYASADVLETYVYRSLTQLQEFGMSAAAGIYQSIMNLVIILLVNYSVRKIQPEYALF